MSTPPHFLVDEFASISECNVCTAHCPHRTIFNTNALAQDLKRIHDAYGIKGYRKNTTAVSLANLVRRSNPDPLTPYVAMRGAYSFGSVSCYLLHHPSGRMLFIVVRTLFDVWYLSSLSLEIDRPYCRADTECSSGEIQHRSVAIVLFVFVGSVLVSGRFTWAALRFKPTALAASLHFCCAVPELVLRRCRGEHSINTWTRAACSGRVLRRGVRVLGSIAVPRVVPITE